MKNAQEIRQALIQIVERKGRPHYTAIVVRDVIQAFKSNQHHPLKAEVEEETVFLKIHEARDPRTDELIVFCGRRGMQQFLANASGVSHTAVKQIIAGTRTLTDGTWLRLSDAFETAERKYRQSRNTKNRKAA